MKKLFTIALMVVGAGCVNTYVKTGNSNLEPKSADCEITVLTLPPSGKYKELGIIDFFEPVSTYGLNYVPWLDRKHICESGGNALLYGNMDANGYYRTATILLLQE